MPGPPTFPVRPGFEWIARAGGVADRRHRTVREDMLWLLASRDAAALCDVTLVCAPAGEGGGEVGEDGRGENDDDDDDDDDDTHATAISLSRAGTTGRLMATATATEAALAPPTPVLPALCLGAPAAVCAGSRTSGGAPPSSCVLDGRRVVVKDADAEKGEGDGGGLGAEGGDGSVPPRRHPQHHPRDPPTAAPRARAQAHGVICGRRSSSSSSSRSRTTAIDAHAVVLATRCGWLRRAIERHVEEEEEEEGDKVNEKEEKATVEKWIVAGGDDRSGAPLPSSTDESPSTTAAGCHRRCRRRHHHQRVVITLPVVVSAESVAVLLYYLYCNTTGIRGAHANQPALAREVAALAAALELPGLYTCYERTTSSLLWRHPVGEDAYGRDVRAMFHGARGYGDVQFIHEGGATVTVSNAMLQSRSDFFREALAPNKWCIEVDPATGAAVVRISAHTIAYPTLLDVVEFMATGALAALRRGAGEADTWGRMYRLIESTKYLQMPDLYDEVQRVMSSYIDPDTVAPIWNSAHRLGASQVCDTCLRYLVGNFAAATRSPSFACLEKQHLRAALHSGNIKGRTDMIFAAVVEWARAQVGEPGAPVGELHDVVHDLMPPHTMFSSEHKRAVLGYGVGWQLLHMQHAAQAVPGN